ncbi:hypothetical protein [Pseudomonas sp. HS6]|uniref:hypothetical protein n=1 Tax=Pseudomonas sp. HS6 TaxID=2850559 RepID=UPI0020185A37|nr:hypothetical protein [Pseudomonas sp. HS6]UQS17562.1 hypothetical protein JJN09_12090 [Pseudomonas sp. HS6]
MLALEFDTPRLITSNQPTQRQKTRKILHTALPKTTLLQAKFLKEKKRGRIYFPFSEKGDEFIFGK